jgi:uncharacterized membrane protein YbhN (UPF0104 family)
VQLGTTTAFTPRRLAAGKLFTWLLPPLLLQLLLLLFGMILAAALVILQLLLIVFSEPSTITKRNYYFVHEFEENSFVVKLHYLWNFSDYAGSEVT